MGDWQGKNGERKKGAHSDKLRYSIHVSSLHTKYKTYVQTGGQSVPNISQVSKLEP